MNFYTTINTPWSSQNFSGIAVDDQFIKDPKPEHFESYARRFGLSPKLNSYGENPLFNAIRHQQTQLALYYIEHNLGVDYILNGHDAHYKKLDPYYTTPQNALGLACLCDHQEEVIEALLKSGLKPSAHFYRAGVNYQNAWTQAVEHQKLSYVALFHRHDKDYLNCFANIKKIFEHYAIDSNSVSDTITPFDQAQGVFTFLLKHTTICLGRKRWAELQGLALRRLIVTQEFHQLPRLLAFFDQFQKPLTPQSIAYLSDHHVYDFHRNQSVLFQYLSEHLSFEKTLYLWKKIEPRDEKVNDLIALHREKVQLAKITTTHQPKLMGAKHYKI